MWYTICLNVSVTWQKSAQSRLTQYHTIKNTFDILEDLMNLQNDDQCLVSDQTAGVKFYRPISLPSKKHL